MSGYVCWVPLGCVPTSESASGRVCVVCEFIRKNAKLHSHPCMDEIPHCSSPPTGEFLQAILYHSVVLICISLSIWNRMYFSLRTLFILWNAFMTFFFFSLSFNYGNILYSLHSNFLSVVCLLICSVNFFIVWCFCEVSLNVLNSSLFFLWFTCFVA